MGKPWFSESLRSIFGGSPRKGEAYGKRVLLECCTADPRAWGQPSALSAPALTSWEDPCACRTTGPSRGEGGLISGRSPRMRGNPPQPLNVASDKGKIPAHAGKPPEGFPRRVCMAEDPRACGATKSGKKLGRWWGGKIPARAGQPSCSVLDSPVSEEDPRACGATSHRLRRWPIRSGKPPRVRGNHGLLNIYEWH